MLHYRVCRLSGVTIWMESVYCVGSGLLKIRTDCLAGLVRNLVPVTRIQKSHAILNHLRLYLGPRV